MKLFDWEKTHYRIYSLHFRFIFSFCFGIFKGPCKTVFSSLGAPLLPGIISLFKFALPFGLFFYMFYYKYIYYKTFSSLVLSLDAFSFITFKGPTIVLDIVLEIRRVFVILLLFKEYYKNSIQIYKTIFSWPCKTIFSSLCRPSILLYTIPYFLYSFSFLKKEKNITRCSFFLLLFSFFLFLFFLSFFLLFNLPFACSLYYL